MLGTNKKDSVEIMAMRDERSYANRRKGMRRLYTYVRCNTAPQKVFRILCHS